MIRSGDAVIWSRIIGLALLAGWVTGSSAGQSAGVFIDAAGAGLGEIADVSLFGYSVASIGDINGDGFEDVAVGIPRDDAGGSDRGAIAILFMGPSGEVVGSQKISALDGGFGGSLENRDGFGTALAAPGDLDGDGVTEIAVGAPGDDDGGFNRGAVWILFLNRDGTVKSSKTRKISASAGGFGGVIEDLDSFGLVLGAPGDIDGDGVSDLAVGMPNADDGRFAKRGFVWILLLGSDGSVLFEARVEPQVARDDLFFGSSVAPVGDIDGDGIPDLAIGATGDESGGPASGNVVLAFMDEDGTARSQRPVFAGLAAGDRVGASVAFSSGGAQSVPSLVVGSTFAATAGTESSGAVWQVILDASGRQSGVRAVGGDISGISSFDRFGGALDSIGDLNGDGLDEWVVGASGTDAGGFDRGGVWLVFGTPLPSPEITSRSFRPDVPAVGEPVTIVANVSDVQGVARVDANLRRGGESSFFTSRMSEVSPGTYELTIPSVVVGPRGIDYFVTATNDIGVSSRNPGSRYESIRLRVPGGDSTVVDGGGAELSYRLFSVPLELEEESARSVLESELGPYSIFDWRFFDYLGGGSYAELDETDIPLVPGRAYWLVLSDASRSIRVGSGTTIATDEPFRIALRQGWTLVGNPFDFPVPAGAIALASGREPTLWAYPGEWVASTAPLLPFEGVAVSSPDEDTLVINPDLTGVGAAAAQASRSDATQWRLRVAVSAGTSSDRENYAVMMSAGQTDGAESADRAEPPFVGDFVAAYFEADVPGGSPTRLSTDVRSSTEGAEWALRVQTARPRSVTLDVAGMAGVPRDMDVIVLEQATGRVIDVRRSPRFTVSTDGSGEARLRLMVGPRHGDALRTSTYSLGGVFPNPSSSEVKIGYSAVGWEPVTMTVFDVLGRRVARLLEGRSGPPGESSVVWDGRGPHGPAPSGLYVVRMDVSGRTVSSRTLLRVR